MGTTDGQYRIYFSHERSVMMTKHATFDKDKFPLVKDSKPTVFFQEGMQEAFLQLLEINERENSYTSSVKNSDFPRINLNSFNFKAANNLEELKTFATSRAKSMIREHDNSDASGQISISTHQLMSNQDILQGSEKHR